MIILLAFWLHGTAAAHADPQQQRVVADVVDSLTGALAMPGAAHFLASPLQHLPLVFDVGYNDGADTRKFLSSGYRVVAVDANPDLVEKGRLDMREFIDRGQLLLVHAGIEEALGADLKFYRNTEHDVFSSFDKEKACNGKVSRSESCQALTVPLLRCEALFVFGKPHYMKIDIEERHYACVRALGGLPERLLPEQVSWEMHEFAKGLEYPLLDTQLLLELHELGYLHGKMALQYVGNESQGYPDDLENHATKDASWSLVTELLSSGIANPRKLPGSVWVDFCVRRTLANHTHPAGVEEARRHLRR